MRRGAASTGAVSLAIVLAACGFADRPERRYGTSSGSTGVAAAEAEDPEEEDPEEETAAVATGPVVTALGACARPSSREAGDVRRVEERTTVVVRTAPDPWRWPLAEDYERCTGTLRVDDREPEGHTGHRWWPYEPLGTAGGVSLAIGAASTQEGVIVADEIVLRNERPTDVRLRAIRITARGPNGDVVARGQTGVAGVSLDEMRAGVVVERAIDGSPGTTSLPWSVVLDRSSPDVVEIGRLTFDYEIHFYDRLHRITSGEMVTAFADATPDDVERSVISGEPLVPQPGAVRLRRGSDTCLTNKSYDTFGEAGEELALPFRFFGKEADRSILDPPFIVELEVVSWPDWDEIVKSGAVVAEVPFNDVQGRPVDISKQPDVDPVGGWELCATGMRVRVVRVEPLLDEPEGG